MPSSRRNWFGRNRSALSDAGHDALVHARDDQRRRVVQRQFQPAEQLDGVAVGQRRDRLARDLPASTSRIASAAGDRRASVRRESPMLGEHLVDLLARRERRPLGRRRSGPTARRRTRPRAVRPAAGPTRPAVAAGASRPASRPSIASWTRRKRGRRLRLAQPPPAEPMRQVVDVVLVHLGQPVAADRPGFEPTLHVRMANQRGERRKTACRRDSRPPPPAAGRGRSRRSAGPRRIGPQRRTGEAAARGRARAARRARPR